MKSVSSGILKKGEYAKFLKDYKGNNVLLTRRGAMVFWCDSAMAL
jgi:hypothetical protein